MKLTAGPVSDYKGAALLMDAIDALPEARELLADRGYDADWFRDALRTRGITPCIPPRRSRKRPCSYDKELYTAVPLERFNFKIVYSHKI